MPETEAAAATSQDTAGQEGKPAAPEAAQAAPAAKDSKPPEKPATADPKAAVSLAAPAGEAVKPPEDAKPPEKYELKLPEKAVFTQAHLERTAAKARELGLSNEDAQDLLEYDNELLSGHLDGLKTEHEARVQEWAAAVKADKEIGGEAFKANAELARRVIVRFGSEDLRKRLDESGYGNHPELVRMLVRIGKAMTDDQLVLPGAKSDVPTGGTIEDMAARMYPKQAGK